MQKEIKNVLKNHFRPEFLNRLDEIIIFKSLSKAVILDILDLQIEVLQRKLKEKKIDIEVSSAVKEILVEKGYDPAYGARPLKRVVQQDIQNPLAVQIVEGQYSDGDTVFIDVDGKGGYSFTKK